MPRTKKVCKECNRLQYLKRWGLCGRCVYQLDKSGKISEPSEMNVSSTVFREEIVHLWHVCGMGHAYIMNALHLTEKKYLRKLAEYNRTATTSLKVPSYDDSEVFS